MSTTEQSEAFAAASERFQAAESKDTPADETIVNANAEWIASLYDPSLVRFARVSDATMKK